MNVTTAGKRITVVYGSRDGKWWVRCPEARDWSGESDTLDELMAETEDSLSLHFSEPHLKIRWYSQQQFGAINLCRCPVCDSIVRAG